MATTTTDAAAAGLDLRPLPAVGDTVQLRHACCGATDGVVTAVGDCGYPLCGAGDRCVTIRIHTPTGGTHSINRVPSDLEVTA